MVTAGAGVVCVMDSSVLAAPIHTLAQGTRRTACGVVWCCTGFYSSALTALRAGIFSFCPLPPSPHTHTLTPLTPPCWLQVPLMQHAPAMAQQDAFPGAVPRNLESYGQDVDFDAAMPTWQQHLLVDPQTSGGLLLAVAADQADAVLQLVQAAGCSKAAVIGQLVEGEPRVKVQGQ